MTPAQTLLKALVDAGEGTRKDGFTIGGVSYTLNPTQDTITGTFTIPVTTTTDETTGALVSTAKDFLQLPA